MLRNLKGEGGTQPVVSRSSAIVTSRIRSTDRLSIGLFGEVGVGDAYPMIVGGGSVNQEWADKITAVGYALDAAAAVDLCKELMDR